MRTGLAWVCRPAILATVLLEGLCMCAVLLIHRKQQVADLQEQLAEIMAELTDRRAEVQRLTEQLQQHLQEAENVREQHALYFFYERGLPTSAGQTGPAHARKASLQMSIP